MPNPWLFEVLPMFLEARPDGISGWLWDHTVGPDGENLFSAETRPITVSDPFTGSHPCGRITPDNTAVPLLYSCHQATEVFTIPYYRSPEALARTEPDTVLAPTRHYPERGLVTMRTGWSKGLGEMLATFEAKHDHIDQLGHYQTDVGHFTLYGFGANFAVDFGYGHNYGCNAFFEFVSGCTTGDNRTDAGRAVGHNVVIIDEDPETQ